MFHTVELLEFADSSAFAPRVFDALEPTAPAGVCVRRTQTYRGQSDLLILWGPGSPARWPAMRGQLAKGDHFIAVDLAYWNRQEKFRIAIDAPHPSQWVMRRDWPVDRWAADPAPIANRWRMDGPILVAGLGRKAYVQYGDRVHLWERDIVAAARRISPHPVQYRPKAGNPAHVPTGAVLSSPSIPIDRALDGCSRLITWHSNVAVDAIRQGIPVVCGDGAAAAVCPSVLARDQTPLDPAIRDRFLANLAWFQWGFTEGAACWAFLQDALA